jgi:MFS family permease
MTIMAGATISPALPEMNRFFQDVPNADLLVKLVLTMPSLFVAISAPFMGVLLDWWGRKPVLVFAVLLYGVAGSSGFVLESLYAILVSRALLGLAVAGIMSGFTTLIADYYSGSRLNQVMGAQGAFVSFGGVVFLIAGGLLADVGWNYPFLVYLVAFLVLPGVLFFIKEPQLEKKTRAEASPEAKQALRKRLTTVYCIAFVVMVIFYMVPVQLPFYLQVLSDISNTEVGVAIAAMTLFSALASMQYRRIRGELGFRSIFAMIFMLMGIGYIIISLAPGYFVVITGLVVFGLGLGLLVPNMNVWLTSFTPAELRGRAFGLLTTFFFLGQFFSPVLTEPVIRKLEIDYSYMAAGALLIFFALIFGGPRLFGKSSR